MNKIKELIRTTPIYRAFRKRKDEKHKKRLGAVNDAFKKEATEVLRLYSDALIKNDVVFWLDFGTLLGYYRDHDFIKHDFDLDTATWFENRHRVKETLEDAGFERVRHYYLKNENGIEECYKHCDYCTTIDVFYYLKEGDKTYCFSFNPLVSMTKKRHLNKVQKSTARKWTGSLISPPRSDSTPSANLPSTSTSSCTPATLTISSC